MPHSKPRNKKAVKEVSQRLMKAKIIQDVMNYHQFERVAFQEMDLDDWFWVQKEAERNIFERDAEP